MSATYVEQLQQQIRDLQQDVANYKAQSSDYRQRLQMIMRNLSGLTSNVEALHQALHPQEPFVFGWTPNKTDT